LPSLGYSSPFDQGIRNSIAYFIDQHVFLPEYRALDSYSDEEIDRLEDELHGERVSEQPAIKVLFRLLEQHEDQKG